MNFIISYIIALILFIILDFIWISFNFDYYMTVLKKIQKEPFLLKIPPIIISYISLAIALYLYCNLLSYEIKNNKNNNKYLIALLYACFIVFVNRGSL